MEIMKLLKVGGKCDKYGEDAEGEGYPVVCGHLPLCARDVPLHPEKNSLNPFAFHHNHQNHHHQHDAQVHLES